MQCQFISNIVSIYKNNQNMEGVAQRFEGLKYLGGFGNSAQSQVLQGSLPKHQNSPVKLKHGLFAEQLTGTAFTVKRSDNQKIWLYKVRPSAVQGQYHPSKGTFKILPDFVNNEHIKFHPNQIRWRSIPGTLEGSKKNFVEGMVALAGAGDPAIKQGLVIYTYSANISMERKAFYNSDGDFLIVPHKGTLYITTQMGKLTVVPQQFVVIPRGIKFSVDCTQQIKGWIAETFGYHFNLPELGPIGANGMANPKDFLFPHAWYEDKKQQWIIYNKFIGKMYQANTPYSPYDVVAWRGNYLPFKYDLNLYNTIGSISYDHPDPSIFTVLTCRSAMEGTAALDFVVFPPRWLVAEHTFKPPYYHRNCMSEFMGNISGQYDAKGKGFGPGCSSLHSCMTPHGPDAQSYENFVKSEQKPYKIQQGNFSFMFESGYLLKTTKWALQDLPIDDDYYKDWLKLAEIKYEGDPEKDEKTLPK